MNRFLICLLTLFCLLCTTAQTQLFGQPNVEEYLKTGQLDAGHLALTNHLNNTPDDDEARFGLGFLEFLQGIEHLGQSMYDYGVAENSSIPFLRMPVPKNDKPKPIRYKDTRVILETMVRDLKRADKTLSKITSKEVKLALHPLQFHLDWNQDGVVDKKESFGRVAAEYIRWDLGDKKYQDLLIHFDKADVHWLRGYCNLICGLCEFILAYDQEATWDVTARRAFPSAIVRYDFLMEEDLTADYFFSSKSLSDLIAGIHNLGMPLVDAEKVKRAHGHLTQALRHSRKMWDQIQSETDNDHEWIPNPTQKSAVTTLRISEQMVETWYQFLNEGEAILKGEKLVIFWRGTDETRGVNLYRVFHEPRNFDIVLWVHGSGATPYLEKGEVSSPETWRQFQRVFRGDFIGFATWFN